MIFFFFAVLLSVIAVGEGNPFTLAHSHIHPVFLDQKNYLDGVRVAMGHYTEMVTFDLVEIVASEISGWQRRGKTCRENILRPRNTEEIGEELRVCVHDAIELLHTHIDIMWQRIEEAQLETQDIQLVLLRELQREDILEVSDEFYYNAVEMGNRMMERFYDERYPLLRSYLTQIEWAVDNLPTLLQDCLDGISRKFTMYC